MCCTLFCSQPQKGVPFGGIMATTSIFLHFVLQVNSRTCVLYDGIPLLAQKQGCFKQFRPKMWVE